MRVRGLAHAVAVSVLLHGVAAAAMVVWDRSRPIVSDTAEERSIAVEVVWAAVTETAVAERPPAPALRSSLAAEATLAAASMDASAPALSPRVQVADLVHAIAEQSELPPAPAAEISTPLEASESLDRVAPEPSLVVDAVTAESVSRSGNRIASLVHVIAEQSGLPPGAATAVSTLEASESLAPATPETSLPAPAAQSPRAGAGTAATAVGASADATAGLRPASDARAFAVAATETDLDTTAVAGDSGAMWVPADAGNARPEYPPLARRRGLEGQTLLQVEVLTSGESGAIAVVSSSGHAVLDNAALAAVRRWKFVPAGDGAREAAAYIEVPVSFRLLD